MIEQANGPSKRRPRAATVSMVLGAVAWLSPLISVIGGMLIYSGGAGFAGDGGPNLMWIIYLICGVIGTGVLGIAGSVVCLFGCGASSSPEVRDSWRLPKLLNYPLGIFGLVGGLYWLSLLGHL